MLTVEREREGGRGREKVPFRFSLLSLVYTKALVAGPSLHVVIKLLATVTMVLDRVLDRLDTGCLHLG